MGRSQSQWLWAVSTRRVYRVSKGLWLRRSCVGDLPLKHKPTAVQLQVFMFLAVGFLWAARHLSDLLYEMNYYTALKMLHTKSFPEFHQKTLHILFTFVWKVDAYLSIS